MVSQSSQELLGFFSAPALLGPPLDVALAQTIQTTLQKLPAPKDITKTTKEYIELLKVTMIFDLSLPRF
jgi:hypothetical protein